MTVTPLQYLSSTFLSSSKLSFHRRYHFRTFLLALLALLLPSVAHAVSATTTILTIASSTVAYKSPILLTATVKSNGLPVTSGLVLFCDATATFCENNSALALAQLTASGASAVVKIGSGPLGTHSYKAVYRANTLYAASTSNTITYSVVGSYTSTTTLASSGTVGNYSLTATVVGIGSVANPPTGNVSFLDASAGNHLLGTEPLGPATLSHGFVAAAGSPFAIGGGNTTVRSVAIASAYLSSDNNLDVVTGDAAATITVLMGNGDGTFKPKVNYPGCATGRALKILLADFNRDGNTDVILGCSDGTNGGIAILLGNGDGSFQTPTQYTSGDAAGLALGDFNNDGLLDLVITNRTQHNVTLFLGKGDGSLQSPVSVFTTTANAHDVVVADFNGDGKDDLIFAVDTAASGSTLSDLFLALGNGDGTFSTPTLKASQVGEFLTTGDTNGDNFPDIISSTITLPVHVGNNMWVLIGKGDGTFQPTVTLISDIPSDPHLADVNGDGKPDIIAGGSTGALVYQGNGDGTFQPYTQPSIANFALTYAVNAGDYNNDGNADLIGTDALSPQAAVALSEVRQTATTAALTGLALLPLGSGTHNVDASYDGDNLYATSLSATTPLLAAPTPTTLSLSVAPTSATLQGQTLTLTATLKPYAVGPPNTTTNGETVKFFNGGTQIGAGTLTNGVATLATSTLPVGTDALKAVFPGDANYLTSTSSTINVTVTSILISSSLNPSSFGQSVTFTATVAAGATGTVTFNDGATALGTATISGGIATLTTSTLPVGSHDITGVYSGDATHNTATSPILTQVVKKATPTITVTTPGPSTYGSPVDITVTLPAGTTGTVTVTSGSTTLGTGTVTAAGTVTITTSSLPTGTDPITASYSGDGSYNPATGTGSQTVNKANPVLPAPVVNPTSPVTGTPVTITQTVPPGVSGPVTFYDGTTVLGTAPVVTGNANGTATLTVPSLPVGANPISTTTPGDTNNNPATSPTTTVTVVKTTPTVTVTTSGPSTFGSPVTITATVPTGVTGTVTIISGGVTLGTGTVVNGILTITTSTLPTGTDPITATYSGDSNNNANTGATSQTVSKNNPTVTVTTSGPSTFGSPVAITATVPPGVTGTVTITSGTTTLGTGTVTAAGTVTITTSTLPPGNNPISASYGGDSNNNPATGSTSQTVTKATPTVTVTTSGPSTFGSPVTITATVPPGVTGTVTITNGGVTLGTGTVVPGNANGVVTITTSTLPTGSDPITASYGGDANNNPNTGTTTQVVSKTNPTVTVTTSGPSTYGDPVIITATVPPGVTGTVTITSGGVILGTGTVSPTGTVTITTSSLPPGSDPITASYSGDTNTSPATGTTTQTVSKTTPTVTVTTSGPSTYGSPVTITATVPPGVTGTVTLTSGGTTLGTGTVVNGTVTITASSLPAGNDPITGTYNGDANNNPSKGNTTQTVTKTTPTVTVTSSGPGTYGATTTITTTVPPGTTGTVTITSGGVTIGTGTVTPTGTVTITTTNLPAGTDPITINFGGDSNNNPTSTSTTVTIIKQTPTVVLTSSNNPSTVNQPVTFTATVAAGVTGTVSFYNGTTLLGTGTIVLTGNANGVATFTTSTLPAGSATITAGYGGDSNNNTATSAPLAQTVNKASPTLPAPGVSSNNPTVGSPVTITENVPPGVSGPVSFYNGTTLLGTATVVNGVATLTVSTLPLGPDPITATTPGDANNNPAISPATIVTVIKSTTILAAPTASNNNPATGTPVTISQVVPTGVTGPISFYNGGTLLGTATPINGVATLTVPTLPVGQNPITTTTTGDANTNPATSPVLIITAAKAAATITLASSLNPSAFNQSVTFTATVPAGATGNILFLDGTVLLGALPINATGVASLSTSSLIIGAHPITATFAGDTNFSAITSLVLTQNVSKPLTTTVLTQSTAAQILGTSVTFTATVASTFTAPTGTVSFFDGSTLLGTAPLSTTGAVAFSISTLTTGAHTITAAYSGDAVSAASASAPLINTVHDFTNTAMGTTTISGFPGATAAYNFDLTPLGTSAFVENVTITITGLPVGTTYSFTPAMMRAGTGKNGSILNLKTSASLNASNHAPSSPLQNRSTIALGLLGLVGLGAARKRRHQLPRLVVLLLLCLGSLLPLAAVTGCAGGYFALTPTTYNLQVTATEGAVQHTANVTLVVQ